MPNGFFLFPFHRVKATDNILIYGAGKVGRYFLAQLKSTNYCHVKAVVDQQAGIYHIDSVDVILPSQIKKYAFDKIVVAIHKREIAEIIRDELVKKYDVEFEKIVLGADCEIDECLIEKSVDIILMPGNVLKKPEVRIAFLIGLGLGDDIIFKKFFSEFLNHINDTSYHIDFFVPSGGMEYAYAIFGDCKCISNFYQMASGDYILAEYNFVIEMHYIPNILKYDYASVISMGFTHCAEFLRGLQAEVESYGLSSKIPTNMSVHFARCKFLGYNCYTAYSFGHILEVSDNNVEIRLNETYRNKFEKLCIGLHAYITINFGWGNNPNGKDKIPNKIWPIRHYEYFIKLFHEAFPQIAIVQLGQKGSTRLDGVDRYVFGEKIETIKYVLKNSLLHIDCEGGLVHLATQLGTKCVVLFGPTPLHYFGYEQNINISSPACTNCCFLYPDFSSCARGMDEPKCMVGITPLMVMDRVSEYLRQEG